MADFDHGIPPNKYNPHAWIIGEPQIGEHVYIGAFTQVESRYGKVTIGTGTNISCGVQIVTHSTVHRCISEGKYAEIDHADVIIGDYCFIGLNAVILMGATIGHHSVIGAGCVITEHMTIPPYSIVAGVPAKIIGSSKKYI